MIMSASMTRESMRYFLSMKVEVKRPKSSMITSNPMTSIGSIRSLFARTQLFSILPRKMLSETTENLTRSGAKTQEGLSSLHR